MKIKIIILSILLILVCLISFESCSLFGIKIDERIKMFEDDLNTSDRSGINSNFHPTETQDYGVPDSAFWETHFPVASISFSISYLDDSNSDNVTGKISGSSFPEQDISFKMAKDGCDWMIEELTLAGTTIVD